MRPEESVIITLLEKLPRSRGTDYYFRLEALRYHLRQIDDKRFAEEIGAIRDPMLLGYLMSAGLSKSRQDILAGWQPRSEAFSE